MNQDTGRRSGLRQAGLFFLLAVIVSYWKHEHELDSFLRNGSDSLGYYQWLPALLIEGRLDAMPWTYVLENGQGLSLFNMGVALLQLPFFLIGHAWALVSGAEANCWSAPYAVAQFAAAAFYLALGCLFVFRALRRYHDERTALWTTTMLYLGTNLFYYASFEPGMSHVYAFFLFALLWWLTEKWIAGPSPALLIGLSAVLALIVLVRPLNACAALLPLFYRTHGLRDVTARLRPILSMRYALAVSIAVVLLFFIPQMMYWRTITGHWLTFTYGTKGESFDFRSPHILDILVSHQNGWFIYTPLMLPVLLVLIFQARKAGTGARTILVVWSIAWYLYGSWWAWWLGGAFGYRGFLEYTALLALPLATIVQWALRLPLFWRRAFIGLAGFIIFLNVRLSIIYMSPWDGPDWTWARCGHEMERALFLVK